MKKKIINTLKSVGLILLILTFTSFMFVLLNIDVNSISDVKYLFYLSIFDLLLLIIYFFIYKDTIIKDFKKYFSDFNKNFEFAIYKTLFIKKRANKLYWHVFITFI